MFHFLSVVTTETLFIILYALSNKCVWAQFKLVFSLLLWAWFFMKRVSWRRVLMFFRKSTQKQNAIQLMQILAVIYSSLKILVRLFKPGWNGSFRFHWKRRPRRILNKLYFSKGSKMLLRVEFLLRLLVKTHIWYFGSLVRHMEEISWFVEMNSRGAYPHAWHQRTILKK